MKSIIAINLSAICVPISGIFVEKATQIEAEAGEFVVVRAFCTFFVAGIILVRSKKHVWKDILTGKFKFVVIIACCSTFGFCSMMVGFSLMQLSTAIIILNTAPFWTTLLAHFFNGEPILK